MSGYKAAVRDRITLGVGEQLTVPFTLDVGQISEEVVVRRSAAARHDVPEIGRPVRHPPGGEPADVLEHADHAGAVRAEHQRERSTDAGVAGLRRQHVAVGGSGLGLPLGGTQPTPPSFGGNNYTLDGANNNGSSRRIAASPNSDMIRRCGSSRRTSMPPSGTVSACRSR
jgi:hypothetical protein